MRIPPPPLWLMMIILVIAVLGYAIRVSHGAAIPYYAGKPPPAGHYKGRCWCAVHGPRGGCIRWICPKTKMAPKLKADKLELGPGDPDDL